MKRELAMEREEFIAAIREELRRGEEIPDSRFDEIFPQLIRKLSDSHWTPVATARRAAQMLGNVAGSRILDVGSGCGKFCIVGALTTPAEFTGIEQRPWLVEVAQSAAKRLNAGRASFVCGEMAKLDWRAYTGIYFFNPFYEHLSPNIRIDSTILYSDFLYQKYLDIVKGKLRVLRAGTRVVTYYSFGGTMPRGFRLVCREPQKADALELWVKE